MPSRVDIMRRDIAQPFVITPAVIVFDIAKIKSYLLTDENLTDLVRIINEELDGSIRKYQERLEAIDRKANQ